MKLRDFLKYCQKMVVENPDALDMEMFSSCGSSGINEPLSTPSIEKISSSDNSETPVRDQLGRLYPYDSIISVYSGN